MSSQNIDIPNFGIHVGRIIISKDKKFSNTKSTKSDLTSTSILYFIENNYINNCCQIFGYVPSKIQEIDINHKKLNEVIIENNINLYIHGTYLISPIVIN